MKATNQNTDDFSSYCDEELEGLYDCVDRIVVNAYYPMGQSAAGFRTWWRQMYGSDETLDRAHITRMAGDFARRLRGSAKKHGIPVVYVPMGKRKDEIWKNYLPPSPEFSATGGSASGGKGVFLILISRAPAPVWEVKRRKGRIVNIFRKDKWPYVNYFYIHLKDPDWGHMIIRMSSYPPFGAQIILNGHEWVASQASRQGVPINKTGNCFVEGSAYQALERIAKALRNPSAIGQLFRACDRWVYSSALCFGLSLADQERTNFRYRYSFFQLEYSRILRCEAVAHNAKNLRCGTGADKWSMLLERMQQMLLEFMNTLQAAHVAFLDDGALEDMAQPSRRGNRRLAGLDMNKVRMRSVADALLALSSRPGGFTVKHLVEQVRERQDQRGYGQRQAIYDLAKFTAKGLVSHEPRCRYYRIIPRAVRTLAAYLVIRERVLKPILAGVGCKHQGRPLKNIDPLDQHYLNLRSELFETLETLGIAA